MSTEMRKLINLFEADLSADDITNLNYKAGKSKLHGWFIPSSHLRADDKYVQQALRAGSMVVEDVPDEIDEWEDKMYFVVYLDSNIINGLKTTQLSVDSDMLDEEDAKLLMAAGIEKAYDYPYSTMITLDKIRFSSIR